MSYCLFPCGREGKGGLQRSVLVGELESQRDMQGKEKKKEKLTVYVCENEGLYL